MKKIFIIVFCFICFSSNAQFVVNENQTRYSAPIKYMYEHLELIIERDSCIARELIYEKNIFTKDSTIVIKDNELVKVTKKNHKLEKQKKNLVIVVLTAIIIQLGQIII